MIPRLITIQNKCKNKHVNIFFGKSSTGYPQRLFRDSCSRRTSHSRGPLISSRIRDELISNSVPLIPFIFFVTSHFSLTEFDWHEIVWFSVTGSTTNMKTYQPQFFVDCRLSAHPRAIDLINWLVELPSQFSSSCWHFYDRVLFAEVNVMLHNPRKWSRL